MSKVGVMVSPLLVQAPREASRNCAGCGYAAVEGVNKDAVLPLLRNLVRTPFFRCASEPLHMPTGPSPPPLAWGLPCVSCSCDPQISTASSPTMKGIQSASCASAVLQGVLEPCLVSLLASTMDHGRGTHPLYLIMQVFQGEPVLRLPLLAGRWDVHAARLRRVRVRAG